ncbi:hypothetical protein ACET98_23665, partial [Aeromonas veronii]
MIAGSNASPQQKKKKKNKAEPTKTESPMCFPITTPKMQPDIGVFQGSCRLNRFFRLRVFVLAPGAP